MNKSTKRMSPCWVLAAAFVVAACGGADKRAETPVGEQPPGQPSTAQQPSAGQAGAQTSAADDVSSASDVAKAERPKMNDSARGPYTQAMEAFARGDLQGARQMFLEAIRNDPRAHQAHYSLGVVQERLNDPDALARYRQAFNLVPDYEPAMVAYGVYMARRGSLREADQFLTERRAKMPNSAAIAAALAEIKSMQRDTGTAQQLAQQALKLNPKYAPAMVTLARDHYRNRRLDLAQYALQAILDGFGDDNPPRDKDNAEARLLRALILKEEGKRLPAIQELERVIGLRPDLVDATVQLATYYLEAGNAEKAQPLLERALLYDRDNVVAHLNLGDAHRLLGRPVDAKREFDWVLARNSAMIQVHYNMGLVYLFSPEYPGLTQVQQAQAAIEQFEKYRELRGRSTSGQGADVEQLVSRARAKKAMVEAMAAANQPAAAPDGGEGGAPDAGAAQPTDGGQSEAQ